MVMMFSSDLIDRGFGVQHDFLKTNKKFDNIVTNPPFNLVKISIHGLTSINNKMALL